MIHLLFFLACGQPSKVDDASADRPVDDARTDSAAVDTGSPDSDDPMDESSEWPAVTEGLSFDEAVLMPKFLHGNAAWAGVALLDYDADGWLDIFFTNGRGQPTALYRNLGGTHFRDVGAEVGAALNDQVGSAAAGDIDNDGDPDLVLGIECSWGTLDTDGGSRGDGSVLLLRNNGGQFEQISVPLSESTSVRGVCPSSVSLFDADNDGWLDIVVDSGIDPDALFPWKFGHVDEEAVDVLLFGNGDGTFGREQMVPPSAPEQTSGDMPSPDQSTTTFISAFMDVDGDGRIDRLAGEGGRVLAAFTLDDAGEFVFMSDAAPTSGLGQWMGMAVADFNGDGRLDVYATNQGLSPLIVGYDNLIEFDKPDGDPDGEDVPLDDFDDPFGEPPLDPPGSGSGLDDPFPDLDWLNPFHSVFLYTEGEGLVERYDWPTVMPFSTAADAYEPPYREWLEDVQSPHWYPLDNLQRQPWGWAAVALDADLDGWTDVAFTSNNCAAPMSIIWDEARGAGPGGLLLNQGGAGFYDAVIDWDLANVDAQGRYQDGRGLAVGDLNNDGMADLVFANRSYNPTQSDPLAQVAGIPRVLLSKPRDGNWLRIDLEGTVSNRDAIGAVVTVDLGDRSVVRMLGAGGATSSSNERTVLLGTAQSEVVDLHVLFPSGTEAWLVGVSVNQAITLVEP